MDFTVIFNMDNAAFEDLSETPRILKDIADKVELGMESGLIRDINGNMIGEWEIK